MQINLTMLIQFALLILVISAVVALVQIILILVDVRQATRSISKVVSKIKLVEYFFDSDDAKELVKKARKALFGLLSYIFKSIQRLIGGEKDG